MTMNIFGPDSFWAQSTYTFDTLCLIYSLQPQVEETVPPSHDFYHKC